MAITFSGLGKAPVIPPSQGSVRTYSSSCKVVNSDSLDPHLIAQHFKVVKDWKTAKEGYNADCGCYCWGYQPGGVKLIGVGALPAGEVRTSFPVCMSPCPCPVCPPERQCPGCPTCPACPEVPSPAEALAPLEEEGKTKFGFYLGLMAAIAVAGGSGYYGYKKGWFK